MNNKLSTIISIFAGGVAFAMLNLILQEELTAALFTSVVVTILSWGFVRTLFYFFHEKNIKKLITKVGEFTNDEGREFNHLKEERPSLESLEDAIESLIKEKSSEIDRLKELEAYRRQFLGNVAHELRTPIFSVQGYLHTLNDGALEDKNVNKDFVSKATKNADHLSTLVEDLMTISRIESGKHTLERTTFDMALLVRDVFESLEWMAKEKNIELDLRAASSKKYFVFADKEMIRQVLENLITNSIKYGRINGRTVVKLYDHENIIKTNVTDNGEGIGGEDLNRIFERFYRVDKNRSRKEGGTGLGLAIVKHFIEAHGRRIHVNSSPNIGTTFSFNLEKGELS